MQLQAWEERAGTASGRQWAVARLCLTCWPAHWLTTGGTEQSRRGCRVDVDECRNLAHFGQAGFAAHFHSSCVVELVSLYQIINKTQDFIQKIRRCEVSSLVMGMGAASTCTVHCLSLPSPSIHSCSQIHLLGHPPCSSDGQVSLGRSRNGWKVYKCLHLVDGHGSPGMQHSLVLAHWCKGPSMSVQRRVSEIVHMALITQSWNVWERGGGFLTLQSSLFRW